MSPDNPIMLPSSVGYICVQASDGPWWDCPVTGLPTTLHLLTPHHLSPFARLMVQVARSGLCFFIPRISTVLLWRKLRLRRHLVNDVYGCLPETRIYTPQAIYSWKFDACCHRSQSKFEAIVYLVLPYKNWLLSCNSTTYATILLIVME